MTWDEIIKKTKEAIVEKHPATDPDKLDQIYSSRMMELQRVLMMYAAADILYSVTLNLQEDTVTVKAYVAQE